MTNHDGVTIHRSRPAPGSTHDLRMVREDPPDLGMITRMMKSGRRRPDGECVKLYADLGYVGIRKDYPGAALRQPHKKKGGSLTEEQRAANKRINSRRVTVEHAIGRIKQYRRMAVPYEGTAAEFDRDMDVVTGLVNLRMLWDARRQKLRLGF